MEHTAIALARALPATLQEALSRFGEVRVVGSDAAAMAGCSVYVTTPMDPVPSQLVEALPESVGLIGNIGVGLDHIDLAAAAQRGLQVSNTPVVTEDTADLAWALIMAACRRLSHCESLLRRGDWASAQQALGLRVHGKTLGIVGFGAIGQAVARRASGFGMAILYHGPRRKPAAEDILGARYCADLAELLGRSDVVSLNCPLTEDTRHLLNASTLGQMKTGAILVNTGRGPLVDEQALLAALRDGHLGGAGLDVYEFEPRVTPGLLELDNVTLLPHIGSATGECRTDMALRLVANIKAWLAGGPIPDPCTATGG